MDGNDAPPALEIHIASSGDVCVLTLVGEIDLATRDQLRECLLQFNGNVIVDLAGVSFLDSSGIATLIAQATRLDAAGATLRMRRPQPNVARVIDITGITELLVD